MTLPIVAPARRRIAVSKPANESSRIPPYHRKLHIAFDMRWPYASRHRCAGPFVRREVIALREGYDVFDAQSRAWRRAFWASRVRRIGRRLRQQDRPGPRRASPLFQTVG